MFGGAFGLRGAASVASWGGNLGAVLGPYEAFWGLVCQADCRCRAEEAPTVLQELRDFDAAERAHREYAPQY